MSAGAVTKVLAGETPAHFVWRDAVCVAFLATNPVKPGHVVVAPREEVDHWIDLDLGTWEHLTRVSKAIGAALDGAYGPPRVGLVLAGLGTSHVHLNLVPIDRDEDLNLANAEPEPDPEALDEAADTVRQALRELGVGA